MPHEIKIFLILLWLSLNISATVTAQPPPPPEAEITVTDSAAPADDSQIPFRSVTVGNVSNRIITVFNTGDASLVIGDIGGLVLPFSIVSDNCSGQSIEQSSSCTFMVRFSPSAEGAITDAFDLPSNDSDENLLTISVSGTGLAPFSNNPPSAPQQISPADSLTSAEATVEFRWDKSNDPDGENVVYDLYVCTDENFTVGCITEVNVALLGNKDVYYAAMGGEDGAGLIFIGLVAAFTCGIRGRKKVSDLIAMTVIIILLIISCGGGGGGGTGGNANSIPPTGTDTTNEATYTASGLTTETTYYWKVVARDETGEETSSSVWSFSTE